MANSSIPMYPFKRLDYSKPWHQITKAQDYLGIICPECYFPMIYRAHVQLNIQHVDKLETAPVKLKEIYEITCVGCGHQFTWEGQLFDPNITPILSILNKKGWETIESCEGNKLYDKPDSNVVLDAYIRFKHPRQKAILERIPLPWKWELDSSWPDDFIIRCTSVGTTIRERMSYLRRWAKALPEIVGDYVDASMIESVSIEEINKLLTPEELCSEDFKDSAATGYTDSLDVTRHYNNIARESQEEQKMIKRRREKEKPTYIPDLPKEERQRIKEEKRKERRAINKQKRELRKARREAQSARDKARNEEARIARELQTKSSGWADYPRSDSRGSRPGRPVKLARLHQQRNQEQPQQQSSREEWVPNYAHKKNSPKKYKTTNRYGKGLNDLK